MGDFFLGKPGRLVGIPAKAKALFGKLQECWAWVLILVGGFGPLMEGTLAKAGLVSGRDLTAGVLSLVSVWCVLLSQGECWSEIETQA